MKEHGQQHPLILVFHIDSEVMSNNSIIQPFVDSVNDMIETKGANVMAFFMPTNGEERIECLNPTLVSEPDMEKITTLIEQIKTSFSIGDDKITLDEHPCECGGNCKCDTNE